METKSKGASENKSAIELRCHIVKCQTHPIINGLEDLVVKVRACIRRADLKVDVHAAQHVASVRNVDNEQLGTRVANSAVHISRRSALVCDPAARNE